MTDGDNEWGFGSGNLTFTDTSSPVAYSALQVSAAATGPVAIVDATGRLFVCAEDGIRFDTGVVMKMPLPEGQECLVEVIRVLCTELARRLKTEPA